MANRLIPFNWLPASWGLRGEAFEIAKANYDLTGYELEIRLVELKYEGAERERKKIEIQAKNNVIDEYERLKRLLEIELTGDNLAIELIKLDVEFDLMEKRAGEKAVADILNEPWVSIIDEGLDLTAGPNGFYFVFDWNDSWITMLRQHGYEGTSEDEMMERWFTDVCRNEVIQSGPVPFNSSIVYD